jgi:hypothetical protein
VGTILRLRTIHSVRNDDNPGLTASFSMLPDKFSDGSLCRSTVFWSKNEFRLSRRKEETNHKIFRYVLDDRDGSLDSEDHRTAGDNNAIRGQNQCK